MNIFTDVPISVENAGPPMPRQRNAGVVRSLFPSIEDELQKVRDGGVVKQKSDAGRIVENVWVPTRAIAIVVMVFFVVVYSYHFAQVYNEKMRSRLESQEKSRATLQTICTSADQGIPPPRDDAVCNAASKDLATSAREDSFDHAVSHLCGDILPCWFVREHLKSTFGLMTVVLPVVLLVFVIAALSYSWKSVARHMVVSGVRKQYDHFPRSQKEAQ